MERKNFKDRNKIITVCIVISLICLSVWAYVLISGNKIRSKEYAKNNNDKNKTVIEEFDNLKDITNNDDNQSNNQTKDDETEKTEEEKNTEEEKTENNEEQKAPENAFGLITGVLANKNGNGGNNKVVVATKPQQTYQTNNNTTNPSTNPGNTGSTTNPAPKPDEPVTPVDPKPVEPDVPVTPTYVDPVISFSKNGDNNLSYTNSTSISVTGDYVDGSIKYAICKNADGSDATNLKNCANNQTISITDSASPVYIYVVATGKSGKIVSTVSNMFNMFIPASPSITASSYCTVTPKRDFATMAVVGNTISCNIFVDSADIVKMEYSFTFGDEGSNWQELSSSNLNISGNKTSAEISRVISLSEYTEDQYSVRLRVKVTDKYGREYYETPFVNDITIRK